jgi:hypothetical protein
MRDNGYQHDYRDSDIISNSTNHKRNAGQLIGIFCIYDLSCNECINCQRSEG